MCRGKEEQLPDDVELIIFQYSSPFFALLKGLKIPLLAAFFAAFIVFITFLWDCQEGNLRFSTSWKNSVEVQVKNNKNHKYTALWTVIGDFQIKTLRSWRLGVSARTSFGGKLGEMWVLGQGQRILKTTNTYQTDLNKTKGKIVLFPKVPLNLVDL